MASAGIICPDRSRSDCGGDAAVAQGLVPTLESFVLTPPRTTIRFFYQFLEGRKDGDVEYALTHTLLVAGRAILFATLINADGCVAFGFADLPPIQQFGELAALAFVLSMLADFIALPAALWILFRQNPSTR